MYNISRYRVTKFLNNLSRYSVTNFFEQLKPLQRHKISEFSKVTTDLPISRYTVVFAFWHNKLDKWGVGGGVMIPCLSKNTFMIMRYFSTTVPMTPSCSCSYSYAARWISCQTFRPIHSCYNNAIVSLVSDLVFGFAHQIQLQFYECCIWFAHQIQLQISECRVWFCASNTIKILWVSRLVLRIKYSYNFLWVSQRHICNIVINFNGHRISCSVSITLHLSMISIYD